MKRELKKSTVSVKHVLGKGKRAELTMTIGWDTGDSAVDADIWRAVGEFLKVVLSEEQKAEFLRKLDEAARGVKP